MKTRWRRQLQAALRACALATVALLVCPSTFPVTVGAQLPIAPGAPQGSAAGDTTAREEPPSTWQVAPAWNPDGSRYVTVSIAAVKSISGSHRQNRRRDALDRR